MISPRDNRISSTYTDGWIFINSLREDARKANKDPSEIRLFALTYPNVL